MDIKKHLNDEKSRDKNIKYRRGNEHACFKQQLYSVVPMSDPNCFS